MKTQLISNLRSIQNKIFNHTHNKKAVQILAVTKTHNSQTLKSAQTIGLNLFGENKVQEAETKINALNHKSEIHLIGHLQSNKAKKAVQIFDVIQTIDSIKIANKINRYASEIKKKQRIYLQINIGNDINKTGFNKEEAINVSQTIDQLENIIIEGIMTILPNGLSNKGKKELYQATYKLKRKIQKKISTCNILSMGMSDDYKLAIECGSTMVRIGTKLFGERK